MNDNAKPNGVPQSLPEASALSQQQWREWCAQLRAEIERLRVEIVELREQRRLYASMIPVPEDVKKLAEMPLDVLLAMCEGQPTMEQIVHDVAVAPDHPLASS